MPIPKAWIISTELTTKEQIVTFLESFNYLFYSKEGFLREYDSWECVAFNMDNANDVYLCGNCHINNECHCKEYKKYNSFEELINDHFQ